MELDEETPAAASGSTGIREKGRSRRHRRGAGARWLSAVALSICPWQAAQAAPLDAINLQMTGVIADVCSVDGIRSVVSRNLSSLDGSGIGAGIKVANLGFGLNIVNDSDPSVSSVGRIAAGHIDVRIDLYCNGQFQLTIAGANGALVNADSVSAGGDFTNRLRYSIGVTFPDNSATPTVTSDSAPGVILFEPTVPAQDGIATIRIAFADPIDAKLVSGSFEEALTLSFTQDGTAPPAVFSP